MSTENAKLITLDHISVLKDYIDNVNSTTTTNVDKNLSNLDADLKQQIKNNIAAAREELTSDYNTKYDELTDKIEENGSKEELTQLQLEIDALMSTNEAQQNALTSLEEMVDGVKQSIYTPGELNAIIETALIKNTTISDDMIETPNLYTKNLVALIGRFGQISAANIIGDEIVGHTIQNSTKSWKLNNDGSGKLANGNIRWDSSGNVLFDDDVKIKFSNVTGIEGGIRDALNEYDDTINSYIKEHVNSNLASAVDLQTLQKAVEESNARTDNALAELNTVLTLNIDGVKNDVDGVKNDVQVALDNALTEINTNVDSKFELQSTELSNQINDINTALEKAIADGDAEMAEKLQKVKNDLTNEVVELTSAYIKTQGALKVLQDNVDNLQGSGLSPEDIAELFGTTQIESTEVSGNKILTPSLLTQKIVSLVGTFGTINAAKIVGTNIEGYTVSSPLTVKDENGNPVIDTDENGNQLYEIQVDENGNPVYDENGNPVYASKLNANTGEYEPIPVYKKLDVDDAAWALKSDGSGHIANGNISWNNTGDITFGDNVSFNWSQINGRQEVIDAIDSAQSTAESATNTANEAQTAANEATNAAADAQSTANEAQSTADAATNAANEAQAAADAAAQAAADAQATADAATEAIIDAEQIDDAITTRLSQFEIASHKIIGDLINGKTIQSNSEVILKKDTPFVSYELNQDTGEYTTTNLTGDGTSVKGPAWQIRNDGEGYLAQGNIQWNNEGKLICNMDSGTVGGKQLITEDMLNAIKVIIYDEYVAQQVKNVLTNQLTNQVRPKQFDYKRDLEYGTGSQSIPYKDPQTLDSVSTTGAGSLSKVMSLTIPSDAEKIYGIIFYIQTKLPNYFWDSKIFTIKDVFDNDLGITISRGDVSMYAYDDITDDNYELSITTQPPALEDLILNPNLLPYSGLKLKLLNTNIDGSNIDDFINYVSNKSAQGDFIINVKINASFTNPNTNTKVNKQITIEVPTVINLSK